jgi:hypothetical protein
MSEFNKVEYGPETTALNAVAMNGAEALRTSAAISVVGQEFARVDYSMPLDASGFAAGNVLSFVYFGSKDNGITFKPLKQTASDGTLSVFTQSWTITAGEVTALLTDGDIGAVEVVGLTHLKVRAVATSGSPDADNTITVKVRPCRE